MPRGQGVALLMEKEAFNGKAKPFGTAGRPQPQRKLPELSKLI